MAYREGAKSGARKYGAGSSRGQDRQLLLPSFIANLLSRRSDVTQLLLEMAARKGSVADLLSRSAGR